ncbi:hypothetical protein KBI23_06360 [bacterium]|nr:hypothetical protein [bacterium]
MNLTLKIFFCCTCLCVCVLPTSASNFLPEGNYIYLGPDNKVVAGARSLHVDQTGQPHWKQKSATDPNVKLPTSSSPASSSVSDTTMSSFQNYQYPRIEWKPQPVAGQVDSLAQLTTTFSKAASPQTSTRVNLSGRQASGGVVKLKVQLSNFTARRLFSRGASTDVKVALQDIDGFNLIEIPVTDTFEVSAPGLREGHAEVPMLEVDYENVRRYAVY